MEFHLSLLLMVFGYASAGTNDVGLKYLEKQKSKPGVVTLPSGLMYKVLRVGEGTDHPAVDSPCDCFYAGTTPSLTPNAADVPDDTAAINKDWNDFDSGYKRGSTTTFAPNQVIKGWTEAMQLMVEGDKWEMYIPSELGYGDRAQGGKIKGGDVLIFRMEIVKIQGKRVPAERIWPQGVTGGPTGPPGAAVRQWRDEEVLASQEFFTSAWKDKYNTGDLPFCKDGYVDEAALRVSLGPAREDLARVAGLTANPIVMRGKEEVGGFWSALFSVPQLQGNLLRCEESGPYTCERFVLDDNRVLISGKLAFGDVLVGQAVSQTWRRISVSEVHPWAVVASSVWKIESEMIDFTQLNFALSKASPEQPVFPVAPASEAPLLPEAAQKDPPAKQEPREQPREQPRLRPSEQPSEAPIVVDGPVPGTGAEPTEAPQAPDSGGGLGTAALVVAAVGVAFFFYRRNNMKQEVSRSVEAKAMLG